MQKGYRRDGKGVAVLRFIIGLILVCLLGAGVYFLYTGDILGIASSATQTVAQSKNEEITTIPTPVVTPAVTAVPVVIATDDAKDDQDKAGTELTENKADAETAEALPVETTETTETTETVEPAITEEPVVTPVPTAEPTAIPKDLFAKMKEKNDDMPEASGKLVAGVTDIYVSKANDYKVVHITGYSYIDLEGKSGEDFTTYVILKRETTGDVYVFQATSKSGVSGVAHETTSLKDPEGADFEVYIDVSKLDSALYDVCVVTVYKNGKKTTYDFADLGETAWLTIMNGEVVKTPDTF